MKPDWSLQCAQLAVDLSAPMSACTFFVFKDQKDVLFIWLL